MFFYCFFDSSSLFQQSLGQSVCVKAPLLPLFRYIFHLAIHNIYLGKKYNSNIIHVAWVINLKCIFKVLKKDSLNFKKRTTKRYHLTPVRMAIFKKSTNRASLVVLWLSICQPMQGSWFDPCSGKISHAKEQLRDRVPQLPSLCPRAREPQLRSPWSSTAEAHAP